MGIHLQIHGFLLYLFHCFYQVNKYIYIYVLLYDYMYLHTEKIPWDPINKKTCATPRDSKT